MQKFKETFMKLVFFICAILSIAAVLLICIFLFANGVPAMLKIGIYILRVPRLWKEWRI